MFNPFKARSAEERSNRSWKKQRNITQNCCGGLCVGFHKFNRIIEFSYVYELILKSTMTIRPLGVTDLNESVKNLNQPHSAH